MQQELLAKLTLTTPATASPAAGDNTFSSAAVATGGGGATGGGASRRLHTAQDATEESKHVSTLTTPSSAATVHRPCSTAHVTDTTATTTTGIPEWGYIEFPPYSGYKSESGDVTDRAGGSRRRPPKTLPTWSYGACSER